MAFAENTVLRTAAGCKDKTVNDTIKKDWLKLPEDIRRHIKQNVRIKCFLTEQFLKFKFFLDCQRLRN